MATQLGQFGFAGYLPDPPKKEGDEPDYVFSTQLAPRLTQVASGDVDLSPYTTETNQYNASSCAGNATADSIEILNAIDGLPVLQMSRMFVYTLARNMVDADGDGQGDIGTDAGCYIRNCFDVLSKFGICREDITSQQGGWPYDLSKVKVLPSIMAMRAATGHRIHSYYRITETGSDRVDKIIEALRANHPVVFGTQIDKAFESFSGGNPISPPKDASIGGHAMIVVGYFVGQGFLVKNSWGKGWGNNGFCILTTDYLSWDQTGDLWVPTKGAMFA
jgi:hypothetical protein